VSREVSRLGCRSKGMSSSPVASEVVFSSGNEALLFAHTKRVSILLESRPEDPGKRMEPLTGEFTFKTNPMRCLVCLAVQAQMVEGTMEVNETQSVRPPLCLVRQQEEPIKRSRGNIIGKRDTLACSVTRSRYD
jgi:hypothetical protein